MKYNDKISGHLIQGHVESVGEIINIENIGTEEVRYSIKLEEDLLKYCIYKSSISIEGISLTIANILDDIIEVAIIPHTLKHTNLSFKKINDRVNIETDMIIEALWFESENLHALFNINELKLNLSGTIIVDNNMMTNIKGIFAAGDIVRGASLVVWGI